MVICLVVTILCSLIVAAVAACNNNLVINIAAVITNTAILSHHLTITLIANMPINALMA